MCGRELPVSWLVPKSMTPMWFQHSVLGAFLTAVMTFIGRWIVKHVKDVKLKLNGYTASVHKDEENS